ncbi:MAG: hypothetical protein KGD64_08165 [Candidatus Heimdallarchaeota archaeon]|nr:hypothetical protein [Candidatus Heimdallarchaeota archaeon]
MNSNEESSPPAWKIAQHSIAQFLSENSFDVWEERSIGNRRIDVLAKREYEGKIYYLVFEVKHYQNVTASIEEKFVLQLEEYLQVLLLRESNRKTLKQISEKYIFIGYLILSKDYGIYLNRRKNWRKKQYFVGNEELSKIWKRNVHFYCSAPKFIRKNLEPAGLAFYTQSKISDFFGSNNNNDKNQQT